MANNTNNIRSSSIITTSSRPDNESLPSSRTQSIPRDNRDLLHPKVSKTPSTFLDVLAPEREVSRGGGDY